MIGLLGAALEEQDARTPPSEVAEIAGLEPPEYLLEGVGTDMHVAPEWVVEGSHREEHRRDDQRQRRYHQYVG